MPQGDGRRHTQSRHCGGRCRDSKARMARMAALAPVHVHGIGRPNGQVVQQAEAMAACRHTRRNNNSTVTGTCALPGASTHSGPPILAAPHRPHRLRKHPGQAVPHSAQTLLPASRSPCLHATRQPSSHSAHLQGPSCLAPPHGAPHGAQAAAQHRTHSPPTRPRLGPQPGTPRQLPAARPQRCGS